MEQRKLQIKDARKNINGVGLTLIVYYMIMNTVVVLSMLADLCVYLFKAAADGTALNFDDLLNRLTEFALSSGWGYILSIVVGVVILLLWKGKRIFPEIFASGKPMSLGVFGMLLCVFLLPQALLQFYAPALEWLLNEMGYSATAALEAATVNADTVSMFLYVAILGPVAEELLFRGLLIHMLRPRGKQAAIVISAIVFGLFHGNVIQIPFAFGVGLVLGYVTVEYSIIWAIVLHIINNFVLSDLMGRLEAIEPEAASVLYVIILAVAVIVSIVLLIVKRSEIKDYLRQNKVGAVAWRGLVSSVTMWIFAAMMLISALLTITRI